MRALPLEIEWIDAEGEEEAAEKLLFSPGSISPYRAAAAEKEMLFFFWERKRDEGGSFFLIKGLAGSVARSLHVGTSQCMAQRGRSRDGEVPDMPPLYIHIRVIWVNE